MAPSSVKINENKIVFSQVNLHFFHLSDFSVRLMHVWELGYKDLKNFKILLVMADVCNSVPFEFIPVKTS